LALCRSIIGLLKLLDQAVTAPSPTTHSIRTCKLEIVLFGCSLAETGLFSPAAVNDGIRIS
jgi:hypothetical protein